MLTKEAHRKPPPHPGKPSPLWPRSGHDNNHVWGDFLAKVNRLVRPPDDAERSRPRSRRGEVRIDQQRGHKERVLPAFSCPALSDPVPGSSGLPPVADREMRHPPSASRPRNSAERATSPQLPALSRPAAPDPRTGPIMISVFGTPSALTYWGMHLLRTIMQVVYGDTHYVHSIYFDDLCDAWFKRDGKNVLIVSECPESRIVDLIVKSGAPLFVFADDPNDVIGYLMTSRGLDVRLALSLASQSYCTLLDVFKAPTTFLVRHTHYGNRVRDLIKQILTYLEGAAVTDALVERVLAYLLPANPGMPNTTVSDDVLRIIPGARLPGGFAAEHTEDIRNRIGCVIDQYGIIAERKPLRRVEWPKEIFLDWDRRDIYSGAPIDMLGPARFLICGPTMHLPRGEWIASVEIEVSENLSGNRLWADVASKELLAVVTADIPAEGVFSFEMKFEVLEPQLPIDVRFQLQNGAIEGKFLMHKVTFRRAITTPSKAHARSH